MECCGAHKLCASSRMCLFFDNHRQEGAVVCLLHTARLEQVQGKVRTSSPTSRNDAVGIPTLGGYTDVGAVKSAMAKPLLE